MARWASHKYTGKMRLLPLFAVTVPMLFFTHSLHAQCTPSQIQSAQRAANLARQQMQLATSGKDKRFYARVMADALTDCQLGLQTIGSSDQEYQAAQCSSVDLRPKMGPVRNQDGVGWCYAFAAADMLSFKTGGKPKVSAADLATQLILQQKATNGKLNAWLSNDTYKGGFIADALQVGASKGLCSEQQIPSQINRSAEISHVYAEMYSASYYFQKDSRYSTVCYQKATNYQKFFPGTSIREIYEVMFRVPASEVVPELYRRSCPSRSPSPIRANQIGEARHGMTYTKEALQFALDRDEPAAIGYDVTLIVNSPTDNNFGVRMHAGTVVGRKYVPGKGCQYLIRNSWGPGCEAYKKGLVCEKGNIWVGEDDLLQKTDSVNYFK